MASKVGPGLVWQGADIPRIPHTIRSFVKRGKLYPVRICRRLLFRPADVGRLIAASCNTERR